MSHRRPASRPQPTARGSCHRHCAAQTFGGPQAVQLAFQRVSPPAKCFTAALSDKVAPAARDTTFEARSAAALLCMSWEVSQKLTVLPLYPQLCRQRSWELRARLLAQQLPSQPLLSPDAGATAAQAFSQNFGGRACSALCDERHMMCCKRPALPPAGLNQCCQHSYQLQLQLHLVLTLTLHLSCSHTPKCWVVHHSDTKCIVCPCVLDK